MKIYYVIEDMHGAYWDSYDKRFRGFHWATKFKTQEEVAGYAQSENIGVFKITKIFDTK